MRVVESLVAAALIAGLAAFAHARTHPQALAACALVSAVEPGVHWNECARDVPGADDGARQAR